MTASAVAVAARDASCAATTPAWAEIEPFLDGVEEDEPGDRDSKRPGAEGGKRTREGDVARAHELRAQGQSLHAIAIALSRSKE